MLTPREMVLRLNGGGDFSPPGDVAVPLLVLVVPVVVGAPVMPAVAGAEVVVLLGDVSGENPPPTAYSERFSQ